MLLIHTAAVAVLQRTRVEIDARGCRWEYLPDGSAVVTGPPAALAHLRFVQRLLDRWTERYGWEPVEWVTDSGLVEWLEAHPDVPDAVAVAEWRRRCPPAILRGARAHYRAFLARHGGVDPYGPPYTDDDAEEEEAE